MSFLDTNIKKDKTGRTFKFYQRCPRGIDAKSAKRDAMLDITEECKKGTFSRNYIGIEYIIWEMLKYNFDYIRI